MRVRKSSRRRGIALIIVMISVMILTVLAAGFAYSMKVEMRLAMNARNFSELEWIGRSGMEMAKYILAEDLMLDPRDTYGDVWAGGSGGSSASNSPLAGLNLPHTFSLGKGEFTLYPMVDTERKININGADELLLQRVFTAMGADAGEIPVVVSSILDWIDRDDLENMQGAESDYYLDFDPPYEAKNGPMDDISELLLIQGVNPEMYGGGSAGPYVLESDRRGGGGRFLEEETPTYAFGLADVFTALSSGRINGMTVDARTLAILPGMDDLLAAQYIEMRSGIDGLDGTDDDELPDPRFFPEGSRQAFKFLDQQSTTFEVRVTARIGGVSRDFKGVIERYSPAELRLVDFSAADDK